MLYSAALPRTACNLSRPEHSMNSSVHDLVKVKDGGWQCRQSFQPCSGRMPQCYSASVYVWLMDVSEVLTAGLGSMQALSQREAQTLV